METALLIVHLMIAASLVTIVLFQQSEGGALGMGGGGGAGGGFMTGRGTANLLTRVTAVLAVAFFCTSILLTIVAKRGTAPTSILDSTGAPASSAPAKPGTPSVPTGTPAAPAGESVLDKLKAGQGGQHAPRIPQGQ